MVTTRKTCDSLFDLDCNPDDVSAAVKKLQPGGSGHRQTTGHAKHHTSEVTSNSQWDLNSPTAHYSPIHPQEPAIYCTECSHSETSAPKESNSEKHLIVDASQLSELISENMSCTHCASSSHKSSIESFLKYCDEAGRGCRDFVDFLYRE